MMTTLTYQRGLTLIELMIAMVLGIIVSFAIGSIAVTSNRISSMAETVTSTHDVGRFAISLMERHLMRAGYDPDGMGASHFGVPCADPDDIVCTGDDVGSNGDRISIQRWVKPGIEALTCAGERLLDSTDAPITIPIVVTDVYWIEAGNKYNSLQCRSFDVSGAVIDAGDPFADARMLVAGIVSMHALYGVSPSDPGNGALNVTHYLNANQVTDWSAVYSVRIALLTASLTNTSGTKTKQVYQLLDSVNYEYEDNLNRQIYSTTITLLN